MLATSFFSFRPNCEKNLEDDVVERFLFYLNHPQTKSHHNMHRTSQ